MSAVNPLADQLARVARARRARPGLSDPHVTLSHGSGGKAMHHLIEAVIAPAFGPPLAETLEDSAVVSADGLGPGRLALTTDAYVVSPLFFPGGDIGSLAVHGTVNDLAVAGAVPQWIAAGFILEEGLAMDVLSRVVASMARAAAACGVRIVTGDTKVVPRGKADGLFIVTTGAGVVRPGVALSYAAARPGDRVLLSGPIGDHGLAVLLAREALEIEAEVASDSAPLHTLAAAVLEAAPRTRCLKDPTRGGLATSLNEIAAACGSAIAVDETRVPVRPAVRAACEILGLDPLYIANEGRLVAVVPADEAGAALAAMRADPLGGAAVDIGEVIAEPEGMVLLRTAAGGTRVVDMLAGDPLPRIC
ncbi:MAG TPA: hydrogenase expression/formation protein HypE [Vicinamibacterales bacterium]|nr:hydrogenase expression/formation protein HypE [Vicinamibacterales bacterium]